MPESLIWKILLVDDDEDDYLLTREMLAMAQGKEVQLTWASSFDAGCRELISGDFDAALIDYDLGEHTGIELIRQAVAQDYPSPLILITGRGGYEVDLEAMQAGATLYLTKSEVNPPLLDRSIRYAIERKQADLALRAAHEELERRVVERTQELKQANQELERAKTSLESTVSERTAELRYANELLSSQMVELELALNESQQKEERIVRLTSLYLTLTRVNEAIVRTREPASLFSQVCGIVAEAGFPLVWIGEVQGQRVVPVAACGPATGYLKGIKIETQGEYSQGPTGRSICEDRAVINDDFATNPATRPWRRAALRYGIHASASFPLHRQGQVMGAFTLYAARPGAFDAEQVALLEQLGADISYALDAMDQEQQRDQAEQALRSGEERFRSLFNGMTEGFALHEIICNEQGAPVDYRFLEINPAFEKLTGLKPEGVIGRLHNELLPGDDPRWVEIYGKVALGGEPVHFENYSAALKQHYEVYAYRPAPMQFAVLFMNITERKLAEDALSESQARLEALFAAIPDVIVEYDARGALVRANEAAFKAAGLSSLNFTNERIFQRLKGRRLDGSAVNPEETPTSRALRGEIVKDEQYMIRHADGNERVVSIFAAPLQKEGAVSGSVALWHDITELKRAEDALRASETRLRRFYESGLLGVIYWNMDGIITDANDKFLDMTGYTREDLATGRIDWAKMTPPEYAYLDERSMAELNATGFNKVPFEKEFIRKDDTRFPVILAGAMLDEARFNGVAFVLDITERKQVENALSESEWRYRSLFNSMEEGFCIVEVLFDAGNRPLNYRFLEVNAAFEKQTGLQDAQGKLIRSLAPALEENWFEIFGKIALTGEPAHFENEAKALNRYYDVYAYRVGRPEERQVAIIFNDISGIKQAEDALRRSQALLSAVVDQMPSGVTVRDARSGDLVLSNARSQEILGVLAGTPGQFDQYRGIHPNGQPYRADEWPLPRSLASGEVVNAEEIECQRSDATHITLSISSAPVRDSQGQIVAGVSIFEDVTQRKQMEKELSQSEQRYRGLFEGMQEGFYLACVLRDEAGQPCDFEYLDANSAFERIMGRPREQIIGHRAKELVPSLKPEWPQIFARVEQTGEPAHHTSYSEYFGQHFETFIFRPAEGQVAVLVNDITERKLAEEKLAQQNQLIDLSYEPIFTWDVAGGILSWNQGCEQLYGYTRSEALGRSSHELLQTRPIPQETYIPELLGQGAWSGELRHQAKDGREVIVESRQHLIETGGRRLVLESNRDVTGRRRSEEALREAHAQAEWLARFPGENPNPVLRVALDGRVLYCNPPAARLPGWQAVVGQPVTSLLLLLIQQAAAQGREVEEDVATNGGFYSVSVIPLLDEGYVNIYGRDIAPRKQAEQALEQRSKELEAARIEAENEKRLLEAVMAALPVGVAITDVQGGNIFNNPAFEQVWGGFKQVNSLDEYAAFQAWWADSGKLLAPNEWASAQAISKGEAVVGQVLEIQRFDGTHAFIINSASPVRDAKGKIVGSAVSIQDITTLRKAQEALRQSEQRWATTLASIGDAVVTTDKQSVVTYLNPVAERLSGWSSQEAAGRPMEQVFPLVNEDTHHPADSPVAKVLQSGRIAGLANHTALITRDGQFIPIEDSAAPIVDSSGQTLGVVMVFHDVTEKRKKETALRETEALMRDYAQKLERSNRELQDFAAIASHDLQEPLRKIKAFSDLLQTRLQGRLSDEEIDLLERMCSASGRMHELIDSLLMYARVTTKAQPFRRVDLRALAAEVVAGFDVQIERSKGRVELGDLPQVMADPVQMRQLLQNLIGNALKFHRSGVPPLVQVSGRTVAATGDGGAAACIEVKDNGIGFEMKYLERIFRPFERLHGRGEFEGTGMGLAICQKIVERHQGTIGANSVVGEGTTFIVTLPVTQKQ